MVAFVCGYSRGYYEPARTAPPRVGLWICAYDAANRLASVSSNGAPLVASSYDWKGRRVRKVTQDATYMFFYDGWNLVEERIAYTNDATSTIH